MSSHADSAPQPATPDEPLFHISFYKFVALPDPDAVAEVLRELTAKLTGSILVAEEGINGVLAGTAPNLAEAEHAMAHDPRLGGAFTDVVYKRSACKTRPFWKVRIHRKREIVAFGIEGITGITDNREAANHVSPEQWRDLIEREDVVVLDNRNSFEYRLGRFKNAVDPKVNNFRDFPQYVQDHAEQWKAEGKKVAMYCTGGIRCEKMSGWMQDKGLDVYQLEGGVLNYFLTMPDADKDWQGECFVFDSRVAIDTHMQETDTTIDQVYDPDEPEEKWRLERAHRLDQ